MAKYKFNGCTFDLKYPAVMGILNLTPDSFSDGGKFLNSEIAVKEAFKMVDHGAQIIDFGGESTRPGSEPVSEEEELSRILPVIEKMPKDQFILSLDTTKPAVAKVGLENGIHIINDVSGGNKELLDLADKHNAGFIVMHVQGTPKIMQDAPKYENVVEEIHLFFEQKMKEISNLKLPRIWMDPGIGFGKSLEHNLELIRNLSSFKNDEWGILLGSSRKSWIDQLCHAPKPTERLGGSIASALSSISQGAEIIRVHDVRETSQAISVAKELALF